MESFSSSGIKSKVIKNDLIDLLDRLEEILMSNLKLEIKEILFYIDATNGIIFCSGFDSENKETIDSTVCSFELNSLWNYLENQGYSSSDFDVIAEKSIRKSLKSKSR